MLSESTTLRIRDLFPNLLSSPVAMFSPEDETISAIHVLLRDQLDVILLRGDEKNPPRAVSGYSIISRLVQLGEANLDRFLGEECVNGCLTLGTVSFESDDLQSLLHTYETSSFGYAIVGKGQNIRSSRILSIRDLLSLYHRGILSSDLKTRDVASSPVISIDRGTALFQVLSEMMKRKVRRMKIADSRWELVTDRDILEYVFQNAAGTVHEEAPWIKNQLKKPLSEIRIETAPWIGEDADLEKAAGILTRNRMSCALTQKGIVTPSDLILKPWRFGRLGFHW